jgi:hypothetical protein
MLKLSSKFSGQDDKKQKKRRNPATLQIKFHYSFASCSDPSGLHMRSTITPNKNTHAIGIEKFKM